MGVLYNNDDYKISIKNRDSSISKGNGVKEKINVMKLLNEVLSKVLELWNKFSTTKCFVIRDNLYLSSPKIMMLGFKVLEVSF